MGTINYGTSKYITLGGKPVDAYDLEHDLDYMANLMERLREDYAPEEITEDVINGYMSEDAAFIMETDFENCQYLLNLHNFQFFSISILPGYYEGFYLDIEDNYALLDNYRDRAEINKEITEIKQMLIEMAGCGIVSVSPGWCTSYRDYKGTIKEINAAVKAMRQEVKNTPTVRSYYRRKPAEPLQPRALREAA